MSHLKRQKVPKEWPTKRKGSAFVIKPTSKKGIPCLVVLRDLLKIAKTRKEVKKAIHNKLLLLNNKLIRDEKIAMSLFDTLSILPSKKYYKITLSKYGKFALEEIKEEEANKKIVKITNKKTLKGKKTQLNFLDGQNIISDLKCSVNDSLIINFKEKKIEKILPLKEKANVIIFAGKHAGEKGQIEEIDKKKKICVIKEGKNKINILIKQLMVIA